MSTAAKRTESAPLVAKLPSRTQDLPWDYAMVEEAGQKIRKEVEVFEVYILGVDVNVSVSQR